MCVYLFSLWQYFEISNSGIVFFRIDLPEKLLEILIFGPTSILFSQLCEIIKHSISMNVMRKENISFFFTLARSLAAMFSRIFFHRFPTEWQEREREREQVEKSFFQFSPINITTLFDVVRFFLPFPLKADLL